MFTRPYQYSSLHYRSLHRPRSALPHLNGRQINPVSLVPFNQSTITRCGGSLLKVSPVGRREDAEASDFEMNNPDCDYSFLIMTHLTNMERQCRLCPAAETLQ